MVRAGAQPRLAQLHKYTKEMTTSLWLTEEVAQGARRWEKRGGGGSRRVIDKKETAGPSGLEIKEYCTCALPRLSCFKGKPCWSRYSGFFGCIAILQVKLIKHWVQHSCLKGGGGRYQPHAGNKWDPSWNWQNWQWQLTKIACTAGLSPQVYSTHKCTHSGVHHS